MSVAAGMSPPPAPAPAPAPAPDPAPAPAPGLTVYKSGVFPRNDRVGRRDRGFSVVSQLLSGLFESRGRDQL